jgi:DNA ligase 1
MRKLIDSFILIKSLDEIPLSEGDIFSVQEKFEGMFCLWDGGYHRGWKKSSVPFANTHKDRGEELATGLWSKAGNVIQAPDWWLDTLPRGQPFRGELWCGYQSYQKMISICKRKVNPKSWEEVTCKIFDPYPDMQKLLCPGSIHYGHNQKILIDKPFPEQRPEQSYYLGADTYSLVDSYTLPREELFEYFCTIDPRAEGMVIKGKHSTYKLKEHYDMDGVVIDWAHGDSGKRLEYLLGSLVLRLPDGNRLNLGGGIPDQMRGISVATDEPLSFPLGTPVTFTYRKLSDAGIPCEARFLRIREDN